MLYQSNYQSFLRLVIFVNKYGEYHLTETSIWNNQTKISKHVYFTEVDWVKILNKSSIFIF